MSKRVLVLVQRSGQGANVTDKTPTVVWEHEVPILEEIHGDGAVEVILDYEDLLDSSITKERRKQIDHIVAVNGLGDEFKGDPHEEYQRLMMKYGQHTEIRTSNVEKVFGAYRNGAFQDACGVSDDYEEMRVQDLRKLCDELGISYRATDSKVTLANVIRARRQEEGDEAEIKAKKAA